MTSELERRPRHYAWDYMAAQKRKDKEAMQRVWDSVPAHLLDMVKAHISNERERAKYGSGRKAAADIAAK